MLLLTYLCLELMIDNQNALELSPKKRTKKNREEPEESGSIICHANETVV